jgi:hypothetical protein
MLPLPVIKSNQFRSYHDPLPRGHRTTSRPVRQELSASTFLVRPSAFESLSSINCQQTKKRPARRLSGGPWPPWRLIATLPKLRIELTHANKRLNNFLIATKTALRQLHDSPREWPGRTERARIAMRLLLLKFLPGDPSGLQDRACSPFHLAGTK